MIKKIKSIVMEKLSKKYGENVAYQKEGSFPNTAVGDILGGYFFDEKKINQKLVENLLSESMSESLKDRKDETIEVDIDITSYISYGIYSKAKKKTKNLLELLYTDMFNKIQNLYTQSWYIKPDITITDKKVILKYNFSRRHSSCI